jgi:histidine triad (HIT) family protein
MLDTGRGAGERKPQGTRKSALPAGTGWVTLVRMEGKTLFEKIRDGEIPAAMVYQDELCFAFRDIAPQAPVHILIVPRKAIPRVGLADDGDEAVLGRLLLAAGRIARAEGVADGGFRLVINHGRDGGEAVPHLHVHLLAGRQLQWPPG